MTGYWFVLFFLFLTVFLNTLHNFRIEKKINSLEKILFEIILEKLRKNMDRFKEVSDEFDKFVEKMEKEKNNG